MSQSAARQAERPSRRSTPLDYDDVLCPHLQWFGKLHWGPAKLRYKTRFERLLIGFTEQARFTYPTPVRVRVRSAWMKSLSAPTALLHEPR
jgi:hypothetical protein